MDLKECTGNHKADCHILAPNQECCSVVGWAPPIISWSNCNSLNFKPNELLYSFPSTVMGRAPLFSIYMLLVFSHYQLKPISQLSYKILLNQMPLLKQYCA